MRRRLAVVPLLLVLACRGEKPAVASRIDCPSPCTLDVLAATTLARPFRAALDSFAARSGASIAMENGGSLELARRVTELGQQPDVLALADEEVFPALLAPAHVDRWTEFARNRMVLAWTDHSRNVGPVDSTTWRRVLLVPGVLSARSDPNRDPMGYRTLLLFQLAERHYGDAGLAARLAAAAPERFMRSRSSELVGLLQTGEVDFIWTYESVARAAGLRFLHLPDEIDLGSPAQATRYAEARVRVVGLTPRDSVTMHGTPIRYALAIPRSAPHRAAAERFVRWLGSAEGVRVLRGAGLDALDTVRAVTAPVAQPAAAAGARP